jgi:hypothetical protein
MLRYRTESGTQEGSVQVVTLFLSIKLHIARIFSSFCSRKLLHINLMRNMDISHFELQRNCVICED